MSAHAVPHQSAPAPLSALRWFLILGAIYMVGMRVVFADTTPLWLDETWSGMIATRPDWPSFWREAWLDCNPPLYYLLLAGWTSLFGDSNIILRLPSMMFVLAAAALPLVWRPHGLNRAGVWTWSGLILFWPPNLAVMVDARGYGLMLFLATISSLLMIQMLNRLTLRRATCWVGIGTMMFLTHYYAAVLILGQILILTYHCRWRLVPMWPALFPAIPGLLWFACHLPRLKDYARADVAWYDPTTFHTTLLHLAYVVGAQNYIVLGVLAAVAMLSIYCTWRGKSDSMTSRPAYDGTLIGTATASVIGFVIAIGISLYQPSLTNRYLVPLIPGTMLGLTLVTQRWLRQKWDTYLVLFAFLLPSLNINLAKSELAERSIYSYEKVSDFIRYYQPDRLVFLWDSPSAKIMDHKSLDSIGRYFLERKGLHVPTRAIISPRTSDPNLLLRAAADGGKPAIIWLYNTQYFSAAKDHPPTFQDDPAWICSRGLRSDRVGSIGCVKQATAAKSRHRNRSDSQP